jgi:D-alanyl-lipoteichoic acid acyltransferase DltB (MBOAT superfamily)
MQFNSFAYISFFLIVYIVYRVSPHRFQNFILLIASYLFYAWWDVRFLFLIILSTVINYSCSVELLSNKINVKERIAFSAWIILAYFVFVVVQWDQAPIFREAPATLFSWSSLIAWREHWKPLLIVCVTTLVFNLIYPKIAKLDEKRRRGLILFLGVGANLFILGFFKYYNFFIQNIEWLLRGLNMDPARFHLNIILPVGISFFTFKGIGYIVDVYRGTIKTEYRYSDFALFIAFFPSLLAGPIDRGATFLCQLCSERKFKWEQFLRGIHLFFYGLFKKVVIADGVVRSVNSIFISSGQPSWIDIIAATLLFTIQIYCDFSGYTDMARGAAKIFGIDLMINFKLPYFSKNPREFWNRWHISLSTWLRDYLYIPLGGNRFGKINTYRNLLTTMVLGGLWHGAAWNFVLWGFYHGLILSLHRAFNTVRSNSPLGWTKAMNGLKMLVCIIAIAYGWLLFRAPSLETILSFSSTLIWDFGNMDLGIMRPKVAALLGIILLAGIELIEYLFKGEPFYKKLPMPAWTALYSLMIFAVLLGMGNESAQFIYFNF